MIEAVSILKKEGLSGNIQCQILGSGPEEEKLKELARVLGLSNEVVFLGHIDPEVVYSVRNFLLRQFGATDERNVGD